MFRAGDRPLRQLRVRVQLEQVPVAVRENFPIQQFVVDEAQQTFAIANSESGIYNDLASVEWQTGDTFDADEEYAGYGAQMKPMLELGSGAMIAFMSAAANIATDGGLDVNRECDAGLVFNDTTGLCAPTAPPPQSEVPAGSLVCASGDCTFSADGGGAPACPPADVCSETVPCTGNNFCSGGCCEVIPK